MRTSLLLLLVFLVPGAAGADEDVVTAPVEVRGTRPTSGAQAPGAARALEEPAFVTVVPVDGHRDETVSAAEALAETVGVSVRSLGGLGAFASISMRGAPSGQTEILVDGVPLSRVAFAAVDVGALDLATFDRVEVIRGGVPAELGGAVLGGAVNFVSAVGPSATGAHNSVTIGGGSYGARRVRVARGDAFGRWKTSLAAGYAGAEGDFDYFDDHGTPLNPADDATRERKNNDWNGFDAAARAVASGPTRLSGGVRYAWKAQGVPGSTGAGAEHTRLRTHRGIADVEVRHVGLGGAPVAVGGRAYGLVEAQRYRDVNGELGLTPGDSTTTTGAGGLALSGEWVPSELHHLTVALEGRLELLSTTDHLGDRTGATGNRLGGAVVLADELTLLDERLALVPAIRIDLLRTRGGGDEDPVVGGTVPDARDDAFASPRFGVRARVTPALTLKANAGRYFRPPTVVELFGDRGFVTGNASLRPETGWSGDAGVVFAPSRRLGPVDRVYVEAALFGARISELIAFLPTAGRRTRADNLQDARIVGVELALSARLWRTLTLTGNTTVLDTRQLSEQVFTDGKQLPGRPRHELYLRADVSRRVASSRWIAGGFADLTLVAGNYLDEGNLNQIPARQLLGAGVRVTFEPGPSVVLQVKNLLDARVEDVDSAVGPVPRAVADVLDYPLPGRAFHASLDWTF